jgi:hypothetical protein
MTITILLMLAGVLATEATGSSPEGTSQSQASARSATSSEAFKTEPRLALWRPLGHPLRAFGLVWTHPAVVVPDPVASPASTGLVQLQNPRTGVTCTMRILEVKPTIDAGIVASLSGPHPDPIVRNSSSPCVP